MDAKEVFLASEGDAYFTRNIREDDSCSRGTQFLAEFLRKNPIISRGEVLEVGCCDGHNLIYLAQNYDLKAYGVEPSQKAIAYGQERIRSAGIANVELLQGTSDDLPFEENSMDFVILGFCMYVVDRRYLMKTVAEIDRVLKRGGFLVIEDFDVPFPFKCVNKHSKEIFTYKYNCTKLFLGDPSYSLIEKKTYSHAADAFDPKIQERVSSSILYKEPIENIYHFINEG